MKLQASLLVVICGEPMSLVEASLSSFSIFDEVVVLDMIGDEKVEQIAASFSYKYEIIPRRPIVEEIRVGSLSKLSHDWIAFLDPDEVVRLHTNQVSEINDLIANSGATFSALTIKWIFHFKKRPLLGGYWRPTSKAFLINRRLASISGLVHGGYGYDKKKELALSSSLGVLDHYWVYSVPSFLGKHIRYIRAERDKRVVSHSPVWSYGMIMRELFHKFKSNLITKRGYKDGFVGFFLAVFHATYVVAPEVMYRFTPTRSLK